MAKLHQVWATWCTLEASPVFSGGRRRVRLSDSPALPGTGRTQQSRTVARKGYSWPRAAAQTQRSFSPRQIHVGPISRRIPQFLRVRKTRKCGRSVSPLGERLGVTAERSNHLRCRIGGEVFPRVTLRNAGDNRPRIVPCARIPTHWRHRPPLSSARCCSQLAADRDEPEDLQIFLRPDAETLDECIFKCSLTYARSSTDVANSNTFASMPLDIGLRLAPRP